MSTYSQSVCEFVYRVSSLEKFVDGVLVSSQRCKKVDGNDANTLLGYRYELDSPITDELILKEKGSIIKNREFESEYGQISKLRSVGVKFKLLND